MTAATVSKPRTRPNRSALWTVLRLLGGWLVVALLAYMLWLPNKDWGWATLLFGWVLLTLLADEFAGWFGYMALALGVLPFLWQTPPERWFIIFPLIFGALFALLIVKHSGGPFVLPFGAAIYAGAVLGVGKIGSKLDPSLTFVDSRNFQRTALMAMAIGVGFSFVRQLISMIWRWVRARRARAARAALMVPAVTAPAAGTTPAATSTITSETATTETVITEPVQNPTAIDLDLTHFDEPPTPPKD